MAGICYCLAKIGAIGIAKIDFGLEMH
jgi:hypothetical protein